MRCAYQLLHAPYFTGARCVSIGEDALDAQALHRRCLSPDAHALDAQALHAQALPISSTKSEATRRMTQNATLLSATLLSSHTSRHFRLLAKVVSRWTFSNGGPFGLDVAFVHRDSVVRMRERGGERGRP
jgi:hypothetical protein